MWSIWLVFCDFVSHSVCPLMNKDKRLLEASWWERLTVGKSWSYFDGWGRVPSLLIVLRPNYGRGNGGNGNGDLFQKNLCLHCCIQCSWPHIRPLWTHASAWDSWTLTGKPGSVSCQDTIPFSFILMHTRFCLCPPRISFLSPLEVRNQIPLASKVKFPGGSQSLCQIPRLGNLLWALELS